MVREIGGLGARLLVFGLALVLCAGVASAEPVLPQPIDGGSLFGVFSQSGMLNQESATEGEIYIIVHFVEFAPSMFPDELAVAYYPALGFDPASSGIPLDGQFFLLGGLRGSLELPDHLLLSNASGTASGATISIGDPLHDSLVNGAFSLFGETAGQPVTSMTAAAFWSLFADPTPDDEATDAFSEFFGITTGSGQGPVVQLSDYALDGGSEDLFGFKPQTDAGYLGHLAGEDIGSAVLYDPYGNQIAPIPEPSTLALVAGALVLGFGLRRRRRRAV